MCVLEQVSVDVFSFLLEGSFSAVREVVITLTFTGGM